MLLDMERPDEELPADGLLGEGLLDDEGAPVPRLPAARRRAAPPRRAPPPAAEPVDDVGLVDELLDGAAEEELPEGELLEGTPCDERLDALADEPLDPGGGGNEPLDDELIARSPMVEAFIIPRAGLRSSL